MRQSMNHSWACVVLASSMILVATTVCLAGPNLVAIGNYGEMPYKRAEGHDSFSEGEVIFSFDDPDYDFGRVVVRSSSPKVIVRRDLFVGYTGRGLEISTEGGARGGGNVRVDEVEFWLKIQGKVESGKTYEYEVQALADEKVIEDGIPAIMPMMWADGEQIGAETRITSPPEELRHRLLFPRGQIKMKEFARQTGAAWIVIKPVNYGNAFGLVRFIFREIDSDLASGIQSAMPIPVRYMPLKTAVENQVSEALVRGAEAVKRWQNQDRYWGEPGNLEQNVQVTSLAVSALAELGEPTSEGELKEAMQWLVDQEPEEDESWGVPTVGYRLQTLARYGGLEDFRRVIHKDVQFLTDAQLEDGGWSAHSRADRGSTGRRSASTTADSDNDHSFIALAALREARFAGVEVDKRVWRSAIKYWADAQAFDGGYRKRLEKHGGLGELTTTAYTALGAAALTTTVDMASGIGGRSCSQYRANRSQLRDIQEALEWLERNFKEEFKQMLAGGADPYAESGNMQQLGAISGIHHFNDKIHFRELASDLLYHYDGRGFFGVRTGKGWAENPNIYRTALALQILGSGAAPTVCQRIIVGDDENRWAEYNSDVTHLVRYMSAKQGRQFNWRRTTIDRDVRELVDVPILFLNFVGPSDWTEEQWNKIREYCFAGGSVVVNIADDQQAQRDAVVSALRQTFPEYELTDLQEDHPIFSPPENELPPHAEKVSILSTRTEIDKPPSVKAMDNGFRSFLFLPADSWSCYWQLYEVEKHENTFGFMNNLLVYATEGTPPRSSFALSTYAVKAASTKQVNAAHLEAGGTVPAYPNLLDTMDRLMESNYRLVVEPSDPQEADILWVNVTGEAAPTESAKAQMLEAIHSDRKFLFVDVVSGNEDWNENFQAVLRSLDSGITLAPLRRTHWMYTGEIPGTCGFDVVEVKFRKALHTRLSKRGRCDLYEIQRNGQPVGVYSAHDLSSGIGYHYYPDCRGVMPRQARQIAMNAFLTAYGWKVSGRSVP